MEELGETIEGPQGESNPTGRERVLTTVDAWEPKRLSHHTKSIQGWSAAPEAYVAESCLFWPQWVRPLLILK